MPNLDGGARDTHLKRVGSVPVCVSRDPESAVNLPPKIPPQTQQPPKITKHIKQKTPLSAQLSHINKKN